MNKKIVTLGLFFSWVFVLSLPHSAQTNSPARIIQVNITKDGLFVPNKILVRQNKEIIFRVTAYKSSELTLPPNVLHGFYLMYDNIVLIGKTIKTEGRETKKATTEARWTPLFTGEFTLRCPYHQHKFGVLIVKQ